MTISLQRACVSQTIRRHQGTAHQDANGLAVKVSRDVRRSIRLSKVLSSRPPPFVLYMV